MSVQNLFTPRTQDPVSKSYVKVGHPAWLMKPTWDCGDPKNGIIYGYALNFIEHSYMTLYDIIWLWIIFPCLQSFIVIYHNILYE